ncbi:MAG: hypothetical protein ACFBSE_25160 [Prochloraceae cyanobacterium]
MNTLIDFLWLFFTDPQKFTSNWIANTNNIQEILFPITLTFILLYIISWFLHIFWTFSRHNQNKPSLFVRLSYLFSTLLNWSYPIIAIQFYKLVSPVKERSDFLEAMTFFFTVSWIFFLCLFIALIIGLLLYIVSSKILLVLEIILPSSILKITKNSDDSLSYDGLIGTLFITIYILAGIYVIFSLFKNFIVSVHSFYNISFLTGLFIFIVYLIIWFVTVLISLFVGLIFNGQTAK